MKRLKDAQRTADEHFQEEMLEIAVWKGCTKKMLDLSHKQLTVLPHGVHQLTQLRYLYLEHNNLKEIPRDLCHNLTNLVWLDVRTNQIRSLPENINLLTKLTHLLVEGNQITSLPLKLGALMNLRALNPGTIINNGTKEILNYLRMYDCSEQEEKLDDRRVVVVSCTVEHESDDVRADDLPTNDCRKLTNVNEDSRLENDKCTENRVLDVETVDNTSDNEKSIKTDHTLVPSALSHDGFKNRYESTGYKIEPDSCNRLVTLKIPYRLKLLENTPKPDCSDGISRCKIKDSAPNKTLSPIISDSKQQFGKNTKLKELVKRNSLDPVSKSSLGNCRSSLSPLRNQGNENTKNCVRSKTSQCLHVITPKLNKIGARKHSKRTERTFSKKQDRVRNADPLPLLDKQLEQHIEEHVQAILEWKYKNGNSSSSSLEKERIKNEEILRGKMYEKYKVIK